MIRRSANRSVLGEGDGMRALSWVLPVLLLVGTALLAASVFGPARLEDELRLSAVIIMAPFLLWGVRQWWRDHKAGVSLADSGPVDPNDAFVKSFSARPKLAVTAYLVAAVTGLVAFGTILARTVSKIQEPGLRWTVGGVLVAVLVALVIVSARADRREE